MSVGFNLRVASNISETKTFIHSGDGLIKSATLLGLSGLIVLGLVGCSSPMVLETTLTEEKVPDRMMEVADFAFPVVDNNLQYGSFSDGYWVPFMNQDECDANVEIQTLTSKSKLLDEVSFSDAVGSDEYLFLYYDEKVISFDSQSEASEFIELIENGAQDNVVCLEEWSSKNESNKLVDKGTTQALFDAGADNSYAFIREGHQNFDQQIEQKWSYYSAFVAVDNMVLIIEAGVDENGPSLDAESMKNAVTMGIKRMTN